MKGKWVERGFEDFADGTFGNGGHNLYVSRAGVLQRIHQYDLNQDGYVDLVFCNSQNHCEQPPAFVYRDLLGEISRIDLPSAGSRSGAVADLNGDGFDDLVLGMHSNGIRTDLNAFIYFGSPDGFSERQTQQLPAPLCTSVAVGDFNGDGKPDLAFLTEGRVRIFYQSELGFEPKRFIDGWLDLFIPQITSDRSFILWGGPEGFSMDRCQALSVERAACARAADLTGNGYLDLIVGGHVASRGAPNDAFAYIYWNRPVTGFSATDRTRLFTHSASGCVAADFNEDGWVDLAIAYHKVEGDHVGHSAVWWNGPEGLVEGPERLPTSGPHGMTAVEPGNLMDRGDEEYYVSSPHELPEKASVTEISWVAEVPIKTWMRVQLRFASTRDELPQAPWIGPDGADSWYEGHAQVQPAESPGGWVQYRLALGAINSGRTPRVTEVAVYYADHTD